MNYSYLHNFVGGSMRNVLLGAGVAYCIETKNYDNIPIVIIAPSIWTGYNMYHKREDIFKWIREN